MNTSKNINIQDNEYYIRLLSENDINETQSFCERCIDYYEIVHGILPPHDAAEDILMDLPPGKERNDKYVLGVFNARKILVGVVDIVKDFPTDKEWIIGLMMIDPAERRKGLARKVHDFIVDWTSCMGAEKLRIGVAEQNTNAMKFWTSIGYKEINQRRTMKLGEKESVIIVMNYYLS